MRVCPQKPTPALTPQACLISPVDQGVAGQGPNPHLFSLGAGDQLFNLSANGTLRMRGREGSAGSCLGRATGGGEQVVLGFGPLEFCDQGWQATPRGSVVSLESKASPGLCLSSSGSPVATSIDPWCVQNNNMWRSQTDVLQCWPRTMIEVESMAEQGTISAPGGWSFPDCLELGVPGYGSYTWNEAQSVLALFAVTSSPLMLGNDARPGRMQHRLVHLLTNPDLLAVNADYNAGIGFAGGRIWSAPVGKEVWAKPLLDGQAAVVLLNRAGLASGVALGDRNPYFAPYAGCFDLHGRSDAILSPCDDNATASHGAQTLALDLDLIPRSWIALPASPGVVSCEVFDILATPHAGEALGRHDGDSWSALVPPHGVRFLRVSDCRLG